MSERRRREERTDEELFDDFPDEFTSYYVSDYDKKIGEIPLGKVKVFEFENDIKAKTFMSAMRSRQKKGIVEARIRKTKVAVKKLLDVAL